MKFTLIAALAGASNAAACWPTTYASTKCSDNTNCNDCIAGDYCAWCAPGDAKYPDGTTAHRCFDGRDKGPTHGGAPVCHPRTQTSDCITGFVCGGPPDYKCVSSGIPGEGTPSFADCSDSCGPYNTFKVRPFLPNQRGSAD